MLWIWVCMSGLSAQPLPSPGIKTTRINSISSEALSASILRSVVPSGLQDFSLAQNKGSSLSPFYSLQLLYRGSPLHNFIITVFSSPAGNTAELFFPDFPIRELPRNPGSGNDVLVFNGDNWEFMKIEEKVSSTPPAAERIFSDESGIRFRENWLLNFSDSSVRARVFRPDPVSRLQMPYGGLLRDRGDSSSSLLRQAMDSVRIRIRFNSDSFRLENSYLKMGEFSPPQRKLSTAASPDSFWFDRNNAGFEEVNVYYHLSAFRQYLALLGFDSLALFSLKVDAHGMDGADQSAYSPLQEILAFGDGNVDDAEDASVILHEYGHVLCQAAFPFGNSGQERRALEEGICDYLAGSYLRGSSTYLPGRIYRWDGNNEFWPGRSLNSSSIYPTDLSGSLYADGGIFCSALGRLENSIGRNSLHKILLSSLSGLGPGFSMPAAARLILLADSNLFLGEHSEQIRQHFMESGIDPGQIVVKTGNQKENAQILFFDEEYLPWLITSTPVMESVIYDAAGRQRRKTGITAAGKHRLPVAGLEPGLYFLKTASGTMRLPVYQPR